VYKYRFNHHKNHRSYDVILLLDTPSLPDFGLTEITQVMQDEYKNKNPVMAYRQYFIARKVHLAKWTKREAPEWFRDSLLTVNH
jgi:hypothetical protein